MYESLDFELLKEMLGNDKRLIRTPSVQDTRVPFEHTNLIGLID